MGLRQDPEHLGKLPWVVQVFLSGFSVRLLYFFPDSPLCTYGCRYELAALVCGCDGDTICVIHDLNWCYGWW